MKNAKRNKKFKKRVKGRLKNTINDVLRGLKPIEPWMKILGNKEDCLWNFGGTCLIRLSERSNVDEDTKCKGICKKYNQIPKDRQ